MPMTFEQKALRLVAALALIGAGILTMLAAWPPLSAPAVLFLDLMLWPLDGAETGAAPEARLLMAILGGIICGWGVMIWQLAGEPLARDPALIRPIIRTSILVWFTLDSTGSVLAGAPLNVGVNVLLLAAFLVPMRVAARS